jgi:hypothetical protein
MDVATTLWLAFVLAGAAIAWFGNKRQAVALTLVAVMTLPAAFMTLGRAAPWAPATGQHTVLGARIDVDKAIYVLLDADPEPRYFKLPYSAQAANELQAAMDGAADGEGTTTMQMGEDGSPGFAEDHDANKEPPKRAEQPLLQ